MHRGSSTGTMARVCSGGSGGHGHSTHSSPGLLIWSPTRAPVWHKLGPGPKRQEMSPHPFPAWQEPLGAARPALVAGPSGIAPWENGQAQTCCTREQAWGRGGGSYTIPSGLGKAGGLKGPWQLPSPLYPGKETTA